MCSFFKSQFFDDRYKIIMKISFVCFVLDQITKFLVVQNIPLHRGFPIIDGFFNLVHVQNRGAAFGFLNSPDINWQFWLFVAATIISLLLIFSLTKTAEYNKKLFICFGLIVGGALGNFLDRLLFRAVTDFFDFYVGHWHWPAFNIADIAISLGAIGAALIIYSLPEKQDNNKKS